MADDVLLNKAQIIENCLKRIDFEFAGNAQNLRQNQTKQDALVLNIERACQATIDMAMRMIRLHKLGLPKESREAFDILEASGIISKELCKKMHGLVGFRNTAIHNYKKLDLDIVESIITKHLVDFLEFSNLCLKHR